MRTLFKVIIVLVILIVAAIIAIPFFINPNDYKPQIAAQVEKITGRTLTMDGDIQLSVFPWVALELGPLSLSNAKGFEADTFAKVNAAEIRIKLIPLLSKNIEMDTIILDGLTLNLETNKAGKTNWEDLAGAKTEQPQNDADTDKTPGVGLKAINGGGIKLSNINIAWSDATTSQNIQLNTLNLTTGAIKPGKATTLDMDFNLISDAPQAKAHVSLATKLMVDIEKQHYMLSNINFSTSANANNLPFDNADITLTGDIDADMIKQLVSLEGLKLSAKVSKDEQAINATLTTNVSSNLASQQTNVNEIELTADLSDPALPGGKAKLTITTDISADMKQQTATISKLTLSLQDLFIQGDINASKLLSDTPQVAGNINIDAFNLRQLANNMAIELPAMADDETLKLVKLNTEFSGSPKHFNASKLAVTLDQSQLNGQFGINDFAKPSYTFKLALDDIDADRYLPPVNKEQSTTEAEQTPAPTSAAPDHLPLDLLRSINAKGSFDIGKLKISGLRSEKIHLKINAENGAIELGPISANLYQGQYEGNVNLDASGKSLKISLNENLSNVQAGPLLKDLSGDDILSGIASAKISLTGNGASIDGIKKTLNGNGNFSFKDGAVKGVNIAESIRKAKALLKDETLPPSTSPLQTDFASLTGSFVAQNGIISNQDLYVMSPLLRIKGAGTADLPKEGINYNLDVSIVETSTGQAGKELSSLKGLTIPVVITGTFSEPKPSVDLANLLKKQASKKVKEKLNEKLKDELGSELGGLLGGILGTQPEAETTDETQAPTDNNTPKPAEEDALDLLKSFF